MKRSFSVLIIAGVIFFAGCKKNTDNTSSSLPTVTTTKIDSILITSALSGGTSMSEGASAITAKGIVWGTSPSPTVALSTKATNGTGMGSFTSKMVGLIEKTTYYVRAYATNNSGTGYGNEISFVTLSPATLPNVTIGSQVWTSTNLNVTTYKNGDIIPKITDPTVWSTLKTGAWCWYNNDSATYSGYGKLYNWFAVNDARGLAPLGWHIPTDDEFTTLTTQLGGDAVAGGKLKESGLAHWASPNIAATNSSGFTTLPGGNRDKIGNFNYIGIYGSFWTITPFDASSSWIRYIYYDDGTVTRANRDKVFGYLVRCIKD